MTSKLKAAILSALIGLGGFAAIPATAQAEGIYLNYGNGHAGFGMPSGQYQSGEYQQVDQRHGQRYDNRYDRRHGPRYDRRDHRQCSPERAVNKAERNGLRRVRVVDVDRRSITVQGRKWDRRVTMTFSRAPNCPVIRY